MLESAGKRSHRSRSSSTERVRLLQPLLPHPQNRPCSATYSRSQTPESHPGKMVVQDDHIETDPLANMPRGLVHITGSEKRLLSYAGIPPSQTIIEIRIRGCDVSIQGPPVWAVPCSPHFYAMHGCGSLPSATDGNLHPQLPRRLAHSGPVRGSFNIAQDPPPQPQMFFFQNFSKSILSPSQRVSFLGTVIAQCRWQQLSQRSEPWRFSVRRLPSRKGPPVRLKISRKCWALWQQLRQYFSWVCFACDPSSSGWSRGFHPRLGITDATA